MKARSSLALAVLAVLLLGLRPAGAHAEPANRPAAQTATPIEHLVVLMQQNHTFDNYFGTYPGANGLPGDICIPRESAVDCVRPYHIGDGPVDDLDHSARTFELQFNSGEMDGFVSALDAAGQDGRLAMGYYDGRDIPYYWNLADEYILFDNFFSSAHGGSIWNRMYWVAGVPGNDANRIPEGGFTGIRTIFDLLDEQGISWKFYVSQYDPFLTYKSLEDGSFLDPQIQWVPLLSFDRFIEDPELSARIVDLDQYYIDLENGELPAVSYVLALGATEHPLTSLEAGQRFTRHIIQALMESTAWDSSAFLLTYDDWGGWYDHVPPRQVDSFGYGFRVPALLVSPYARQGEIVSTELDFTSILKFISTNWGLPPLSDRVAAANDLRTAFDFSSPPRPPVFLPFERQRLEKSGAPPNLSPIFVLYGGASLLAVGLVIFALKRDPSTGVDPAERRER